MFSNEPYFRLVKSPDGSFPYLSTSYIDKIFSETFDGQTEINHTFIAKIG
jgi:hypothetical protein